MRISKIILVFKLQLFNVIVSCKCNSTIALYIDYPKIDTLLKVYLAEEML